MISIIVSIYNGEVFLKRCLDSLLQQPHNLCEIILVDDGSTDQSSAICDEYDKLYQHVRVIHKTNGGLTSARLAGLQMASGEYVIFIDCDDTVEIQWIDKVHQVIREKAPDLIVYDYSVVLPSGKIEHRKINIPAGIVPNNNPSVFAVASIDKGWGKGELYFAGFMWTRCIKKKLLQTHMFISERLCYTEDILFNLALSRSVKTIEYIPEALYNYYVTQGSLTNKYRKNMWEMLIYRQEWISNYCKENQLEDVAAERLLKSRWSAIQTACNNACKNENHGDREIQDICKAARESGTLKKIGKYFGYMSINEKVRYALLKLKAYKLYYRLFAGNH